MRTPVAGRCRHAAGGPEVVAPEVEAGEGRGGVLLERLRDLPAQHAFSRTELL